MPKVMLVPTVPGESVTRLMGPLTWVESDFLDSMYRAFARDMAEDPEWCTPLWVNLEFARDAIEAVRAGTACPCLLAVRMCQDCVEGRYEGDRAAYKGWN